jgi:hypothetical protein
LFNYFDLMVDWIWIIGNHDTAAAWTSAAADGSRRNAGGGIVRAAGGERDWKFHFHPKCLNLRGRSVLAPLLSPARPLILPAYGATGPDPDRY